MTCGECGVRLLPIVTLPTDQIGLSLEEHNFYQICELVATPINDTHVKIRHDSNYSFLDLHLRSVCWRSAKLLALTAAWLSKKDV